MELSVFAQFVKKQKVKVEELTQEKPELKLGIEKFNENAKKQ